MLTKIVVTAIALMLSVSNILAASPPAPVIKSIGGYWDGFTVQNGRYFGQIVAVPKGGTNQYKNFLASDSYNYGSLAANPYYWDIAGTNFGNVTGTLDFGVNPSPFTSVTIVSWTPTNIRVKVVASNMFVSLPISLKVHTSTGQVSAPFNDHVAGTIKGRGAGQCTWYAAQTRIAHGLSIPPTPWGTNGNVSPTGGLDFGYKPQLWDCMIYSGIHIAIISSVPVQKTNGDGSMSWSFTVSEYNAAWSESYSSSTRTYAVSKPIAPGLRIVTQGIGTNLGPNWYATGYFR
jgi:hypothetical protein